ncbi:unnamed protein product [Adineta ricciae]|uniref:Uncharacterized protein n=1 Tax=Adineta ricciae TaxID=249248 RepID=A0A814IE49_ADIRI|nr:unnamed protein product [Adineta ricciae]CAF1165880.1 unnamed protein product [Adineta ricciae]
MFLASKPLIIFVAASVDQFNSYETLKNAVSKTLHPEWNSLVDVSRTNLQAVIQFPSGSQWFSYKGDANEVCVCSDKNYCAYYLEETKGRRTFIVLLSHLFNDFVSEIIEKHADVFCKPYEDQSISIYILDMDGANSDINLGDIQRHVHFFDHEKSLLSEISLKIADYFVKLGKNISTHENLSQQLMYFVWAKTLTSRATHIVPGITAKDRVTDINKLIAATKELLRETMSDNDRTSCGSGVYSKKDDLSEYLQLKEARDVAMSVKHDRHEDTVLENAMQQENTSVTQVYLLETSFSKKTFENISKLSKQLFGQNLTIVSKEESYDRLQKFHQPSSIICSFSTDDDKILLNSLSSMNPPPSIYLFGALPVDKESFFKEYFRISYISENLQELVVQAAIDMAMNNRIVGGRHAKKQDTINAGRCFDQCIEILKQLDHLAAISANERD